MGLHPSTWIIRRQGTARGVRSNASGGGCAGLRCEMSTCMGSSIFNRVQIFTNPDILQNLGILRRTGKLTSKVYKFTKTACKFSTQAGGFYRHSSAASCDVDDFLSNFVRVVRSAREDGLRIIPTLPERYRRCESIDG